MDWGGLQTVKQIIKDRNNQRQSNLEKFYFTPPRDGRSFLACVGTTKIETLFEEVLKAKIGCDSLQTVTEIMQDRNNPRKSNLQIFHFRLTSDGRSFSGSVGTRKMEIYFKEVLKEKMDCDSLQTVTELMQDRNKQRKSNLEN